MKDKLLQKRRLLSEDLIYPGMFDLPKGLFMFFVLFHHSVVSIYSVWEYQYSGELLKRLVGIVSSELLGGTTVLLFLICGYTWRKRKMKKTIDGQASFLMVPYLLTSAAVTAVVVLYALVIPGVGLLGELRYRALPFLLGLCPGGPFLGSYLNFIGALWCVLVYFFGSILLNWILQEKEIWIHLCLVSLLACVGLLLKDTMMVFCFQQVLICTGYMYLGWLMKKTDFLTREIPVYLIILLALAGPVMGAFGYFEMSQHIFKNGMVDMIAALFTGTTLMIAGLNLNRIEGKLLEFLRWMGRESFLICCVHSFWMMLPSPRSNPAAVLGLFSTPFLKASLPKPIAVAAVFVLVFVTGVGGAYVCKRIKLLLRKKNNAR